MLRTRAPPPYSTTTLPLNRRQAPHSYTSSGYRWKLFWAFAIFILLGIFIREREARIRRLNGQYISISPGEEKGVRAVFVGADRIIGKSYRYLSDHLSKRVSSAKAFSRFNKNNEEGAQEEDQQQDEDEEENELFAQLLVEEKHSVLLQNNNEEIITTIPAITESPEQVIKMMEEGVIEDPHVDQDEIQEDTSASNNNKEENARIIVEGLHVSPSKEEIESGTAVMIKPSSSNEDFIEEHTDEEQDENQQQDEEQNQEEIIIIKKELYLTGPFIKGPLAFKMVNTHFLALMDAFRNAGWSKLSEDAPVSSISLLITKPVTPVAGSSTKMISQISHSSCLGGTKGTQLNCRSKYAAQFGCSFESLNISPKQFNMWKSSDCERFFEIALLPENSNKQWIGKVGASYHGRHITIYQGVTKSIKSHYGKCKMNKETGGGYIMMEYVSDPALLDNRKFDLRTFLLIGSTNPFLAFYHRGFIRRSANKYSSNVNDKLAHVTNLEAQGSEDHFMGFEDLGEALADELGFPIDYLKAKFEPRAKKITNYVFQAARSRLKRKLGAYQLFGLDWMIDRHGSMHLLEGNGNPVVKHYPDTNDLTPKMWREMANLLTKIHISSMQAGPPLGPLKEGFLFGGWELIFSELEETVTGKLYNPCSAGL